jgi:hypothetical protein
LLLLLVIKQGKKFILKGKPVCKQLYFCDI